MNKTKSKIISIICTAITALLLFATGGCPGSLTSIRGNGNVKQQNFSLNSFKTVSISGDWTVEITRNGTFSVTVDADENLFDYLDIQVNDSGNNLHIGFKKGYAISNAHCKASITMPVLTQLTASGSLTGTISSFDMHRGTMTIDVSGSGDITARNIDVKKLELNISGSGSFTASGKAEHMRAAISGSGNIKATDLKAEYADISISGSGSANVWVTKVLRADISGSGSIWYKGDPAIIRKISGVGSVSPL